MSAPRFEWLQARELPIRAVAFDKDGTLLDSLGSWAAFAQGLVDEWILTRHPQADGAARMRAISLALSSIGVGPDGVDSSGALACGTVDRIYGNLARSLARELALGDSAQKRLSAELYDAALVKLDGENVLGRPLPQADSLLRACRASGLPLALITADNASHARQELAQADWLDLFSFLAFSDGPWPPKPAPDSLQAFARGAGLSCSAIAMVGDSDADRGAAVAAGCALFVRVDGELSGLAARLTISPPFPTI